MFTGASIDLAGLIGLARRQAKLAGLAALTVFLLTALFLWLTPPRYTARALVMMTPTADPLSAEFSTQAGRIIAPGARIDSEVELLRSDALLLALVDAEGLDRLEGFVPPQGWLSRQLRLDQSVPNRVRALDHLRRIVSVRRQAATDLIAVSVRGPDPNQAAHLANALAELHITRQTDAKVQAILQARDTVAARLVELRGQIRGSTLDDAIWPNAPVQIAPVQARANVGDQAVQPKADTEVVQQIIARDTTLQRAAQDRQYDVLLSRWTELETAAGLQLADARIVSPALVPHQASFPNPALVIPASLMLALTFAAGLATTAEFLVGGVNSAAQLGNLLPAPVAGVVPATRAPLGQLSVADLIESAPLSPYSEAMRKLRASVDLALPIGPKGRVIAVTSALAGEGKTTTALALARTFSAAGKSVLLVDGDLRNPAMHMQLGVLPETGFVDFLRSPDTAPEHPDFYVTDPRGETNVILGALRADVPTDQLLNAAAFDDLLTRARESVDVVIIDTSPLLPVVDARYVAQRADATLFLVRQSQVGQGALRQAFADLRAVSGDRPVLTVLTHALEGRHPYEGYAGLY